MRITTWNVNGIRAREDRVLNWLDANRPDVLVPARAEMHGGTVPL